MEIDKLKAQSLYSAALILFSWVEKSLSRFSEEHEFIGQLSLNYHGIISQLV